MSTIYTDEGTTAHALAAMALLEGLDAAAYVGRQITSEDYEHANLSPSNAHRWMHCSGSHALEAREPFTPREFTVGVTEDMAEGVQVYIDAVLGRVEEYKLAGAANVELFVEQRLPIFHITEEPGAFGTGDVLIVVTWPDNTALLDFWDLKFGQGVQVSAVENEQLMMYASGALYELGLSYNFTAVRLNISQPRIAAEPSEWETTPEAIEIFGYKVKGAARVAHFALEIRDAEPARFATYLAPGEKQCRFCNAKADCPAYETFVEDAIEAEFEVLADDEDLPLLGAVGVAQKHADKVPLDDLPRLGLKMRSADMIEAYAKAIRAKVALVLREAKNTPEVIEALGFKLVQGRMGNRAWGDAGAVEAILKGARFTKEEMYEMTLISPAQAEKKVKQPKVWVRLAAHITRAEGVLHVTSASDPKEPADLGDAADDFDDLTDGAGLA